MNSKIWAYVDDGVRLDVVHVRVAEAKLLAAALGGANDSRRHSVLEGEGAADGDHKLAGPQISRSAQQQHRKLRLQCENVFDNRLKMNHIKR